MNLQTFRNAWAKFERAEESFGRDGDLKVGLQQMAEGLTLLAMGCAWTADNMDFFRDMREREQQRGGRGPLGT